MRLWVHVIEARGLPVMNLSGTCDPYVKLRLGNHRWKTKVVKKNLNPFWDEKYGFLVGELSEDLIVTVVNEDKYFNNDFLGKVKVSLLKVLDAESLSLGTAWYRLQSKNKRSNKKRGEICLSISLSPRNTLGDASSTISPESSRVLALTSEPSEISRDDSIYVSDVKSESSPLGLEDIKTIKENKSTSTSFVDVLTQIFMGKNTECALLTDNKDLDPSEQLEKALTEGEVCAEPAAPCEFKFDELLATMAAKDLGTDMPANLPGGVLTDQSYVIAPSDLNSLLFSPDSSFWDELAAAQGTTNIQREPWRLLSNENILKRVVTYTKAASKLIKAVKATEEQTYLKADGKQFAVLASASIPDVPCGSYFRTEILYCIRPGPPLPSSDQSSNLLISWRLNFIQSTMMKGMIENGARQGLTENFSQFCDMLSKHVKPVALEDSTCNGVKNLVLPEPKQVSCLGLAFQFLKNFTVLLSLFVGAYVFAHILIANPFMIDGLEFIGLDLPDSFSEVLVSAVLMLHGKYILKVIERFLRARGHNGRDHGVKAQGDGWLLTVALIEGSNIASVQSCGLTDPFVVLTCNGKTKTSSIKFQTANPEWNEVFEFDAMDDPPSIMEVVVYDFDGTSDEVLPLGHAEINFVKSDLSKLADAWIPLKGKYAQACQSKLHLRIFLNNSKGSDIVINYLTKMEKEVGKKINLRSPQTNSAFQKLFSLPPEEFLINDFSCHLKRKMPLQENQHTKESKIDLLRPIQEAHSSSTLYPYVQVLQGRLFLSPRVIGFYANIFGHKTKFFFLWDDIDDIQIIPPSLANVGSPSLIIILSKGRGMDAKHGAKEVDLDGRLKFHFQSFVSFNIASRITMALWKAKSLSPEQKAELVEEESETKEENGPCLGSEDVKMLEVFSDGFPVAASSIMTLFEGGSLEHNIMQKVGCADYFATQWQPVKHDVYQRRISFKFGNNLSNFGGGVIGTQQKYSLTDRRGWIIEESISVQDLLLSDFFSLQLRYEIEDLSFEPKACSVQVFLGISWLKNTKHRKKITKNIMSHTSLRLKEIFCQAEMELLNSN